MPSYRDNPFSYWMKGPFLQVWAEENGLSVTSDQPELVWVDIETTGLNSQFDVILELGIILTNGVGDICQDGVIDWRVYDHDSTDYLAATKAMPDIVHEMHAKSGLLSELKTDGTHAYRYLQNPANVCGSAVYWLSERVGLETGLPLSGSSPHFDRGFLQQQMLPLENWFHYRAGVDASALRETFKRINKSVVDTQPEKYEKHRPVPDLADSIRLFRHMLRTGFVLDEATKGRLGV